MIITEAELRAALGLLGSITTEQNSRIMLAMWSGHAAVKKHLRYEPEQKLWSNQFYPRIAPQQDQGLDDGMWDRQGVRAVWSSTRESAKFLQLEHLPIREVTAVHVDPSAKFGQGPGDFAAETAWAAGTEYYVEWEQQNYSRSGMLIAYGAWTVEPGTVRVSYRAGYSQAEFNGQATETSTAGSVFTNAGIDASPIKMAVLQAAISQYHTFKAMSLNALTGTHVAGPLSSERLGDYSYSAANGAQMALIAGMTSELPPAAAGYLEPFQHYGIMLL